MANPWDSLADELYHSLKRDLADAWTTEDAVYLTDLAQTLARETYMMKTEADPIKAYEHERNLVHLWAQVKGEAARRMLRLRPQGEEIIENVLKIVGRTLVAVAMSALKGGI